VVALPRVALQQLLEEVRGCQVAQQAIGAVLQGAFWAGALDGDAELGSQAEGGKVVDRAAKGGVEDDVLP
jgi:hypothetical protein